MVKGGCKKLIIAGWVGRVEKLINLPFLIFKVRYPAIS